MDVIFPMVNTVLLLVVLVVLNDLRLKIISLQSQGRVDRSLQKLSGEHQT